jgi:transcriptional regulator with XRE-family HTH domain
MGRNELFLTSFINIIKKLRVTKGLTIEQLADLAGVHRTTISLLERHERTPTLAVAHQIAIALDYPLHELVQETEKIIASDSDIPMSIVKLQPRVAKSEHLRNTSDLQKVTEINGKHLLSSISSCYRTLDLIDEQLVKNGLAPLVHLVELANMSSIVGNIICVSLAEHSGGLYVRNKPHAYPDLLSARDNIGLELKVALEKNKPKGHLPKSGVYLVFRYVLGTNAGEYTKGKDFRGNTVWIWEAKVGQLSENDFSCSNTEGDSGKTAVIRTDAYNRMTLVYYVPSLLPYHRGKNGDYPGFN